MLNLKVIWIIFSLQKDLLMVAIMDIICYY